MLNNSHGQAGIKLAQTSTMLGQKSAYSTNSKTKMTFLPNHLAEDQLKKDIYLQNERENVLDTSAYFTSTTFSAIVLQIKTSGKTWNAKIKIDQH